MLANPPQSMEYTAVQCLHTPDQIVLRQFGAPCGVLGCSVTPRGVLYAHVVQARGGGSRLPVTCAALPYQVRLRSYNLVSTPTVGSLPRNKKGKSTTASQPEPDSVLILASTAVY